MSKKIIFRLLLFLLLVATAHAGTIGTSTATPSTLAAGVATTVTFRATITSTSVIASSVNLLQVNSLGQSTSVGTMYDDGTHGDTTANDGIYSLQFPIFQQTPGQMTFRVSAAFQGSLTRALSAPILISVTGVGSAISITSPSQSAYLSISPTIVTGTVLDAQATVSVNGLPAQVSGGGFRASIPLREGSNLITAVARSSNGVVGTASETITLDTTPPHVTISAPVAGAVTAESSVDVSGIVNDIVVGTVNPLQATVAVNGVTAQVANRTYEAMNVPLQLGANTLTATARDRAGNFTSVSTTVTRIPAAGTATLRIVSGDGATGSIRTQLAAPLAVQAFNASGAPIANTPVVFQVITGDGSVIAGSTPGMSAIAVNTNAQGMAQVNYILGSRAGAGNNQVKASATGITATPVFTESATSTGPALIVVDSGGNQSGVVGQALPLPFIAIVTDAGHNRLPNVQVSFTVTQGGGTLNGQNAVNATTDSDGRVEEILTLGPQNGISNNVVTATFAGNAGLPASFTATSYVPGPPQSTSITGVVLDNSSRPIPGVTMRVYQVNNGGSGVPQQVVPSVETNAAGYFNISPAPVGVYKLMADGTTAASGGPFPTLEYDIVTVSGQNNTVGLPIYLQQLKPQNELCVSPTVGGTLTIPEAPGFALTVAPGSAMFPGGSRTGCISVTPVNMDKVPMVPGFGQQPRFIVTIQPVGTIFSIPAQITIPNVDGLKPRAVTEMYSYDHDLASFVAIGTGTVSADGSVIASDPGVGVLKAGWHCGGDPNQSGTVADCPTCKKCTGNACVIDPAQDMKMCTTAQVPVGLCATGACNPVKVKVNSADVTKDQISVTLTGPPGVTGTLTIQLTGGAPTAIYTGTVGPGQADYSFTLPSVPVGEYTGVKAKWFVDGIVVTDTFAYHIRVLGNTTLTQYNTPSESSCSGGPQADTVYNNACTVTNTSLVSGFIFRVTNPAGGTGSGNSNSFGSVYQEAYCPGHGATSLRSFQTIRGTLGGLSDTTLAACPSSPDYTAGARIYIKDLGVKTVTDRCPACCNNLPHFDNYTTSGQCSGITSLPSAITVRIY